MDFSSPINVDQVKQLTVAEQTCGQRYVTETRAELLAKHPAITCPVCNQPVTALAGVRPLYKIVTEGANGKAQANCLPECPLPNLAISSFVYVVDPCACEVSPEWAGSFTTEVTSRLAGQPPRAVAGLSVVSAQRRLRVLRAHCDELYKLQANDNIGAAQKRAVDFWIVAVVDQMQRLCPGTVIAPSPGALEFEVQQWATEHGCAKYGYGKPILLLSTQQMQELQAFGYSDKAPKPKGIGSALDAPATYVNELQGDWAPSEPAGFDGIDKMDSQAVARVVLAQFAAQMPFIRAFAVEVLRNGVNNAYTCDSAVMALHCAFSEHASHRAIPLSRDAKLFLRVFAAHVGSAAFRAMVAAQAGAADKLPATVAGPTPAPANPVPAAAPPVARHVKRKRRVRRIT